jgi:hypothetical protein
LSSIQQHMKSMEWIISTSHQNWLAARPPSFPAVCDNHFENRCSVSPANYSGPPIKLVEELIHQLDAWRSTLPQRLQWSDTERFGFTEVELAATSPRFSFFSSLRNVQTSLLRNYALGFTTRVSWSIDLLCTKRCTHVSS